MRSEAKRQGDKDPKRLASKSRKYHRKQGETLNLASNWGQPWDREEDKWVEAISPGLTCYDVALLLNRTYAAVSDRHKVLRGNRRH